MDFGLSQPQELLRRSVAAHLERAVPIAKVREIMESESGHSPALHEELGEQGVCGLLVAEEHDGAGLGLLDACVAAQELARAACPVSFHSAYVLAPLLLQSSNDDTAKREWLPRIAAGSAIVAPVLDAPVDGDTADGVASYVADAAFADAFLLERDGRLWLVDATHAGVSVAALETVDDTRRLGEVRFDSVELDGCALAGSSADAVERAVQATRIALAADALGAAQQGLEAAVDYAKQREQFGRVIGSYQAVKHLCAEVFAEVDPVQSLVWYAAHAWDERSDEVAELAPLTKAHATETATFAVTQATQVFGGIGFTWECDMHLWYKRAGYDRQLFGGPAELRDEAARAHLG